MVVWRYVCIYVCMYVYMQVCICVCVLGMCYVHICVYVRIMYVYMYVCMNMFVHVCIYDNMHSYVSVIKVIFATQLFLINTISIVYFKSLCISELLNHKSLFCHVYIRINFIFHHLHFQFWLEDLCRQGWSMTWLSYVSTGAGKTAGAQSIRSTLRPFPWR